MKMFEEKKNGMESQLSEGMSNDRVQKQQGCHFGGGRGSFAPPEFEK